MSEVVTEFLSADELAAKKGFTRTFILKAANKYGLPHYKFGRLVKFREKDFDQWAAQRQKQVG
jgi:excisionase family DNA binding protein